MCGAGYDKGYITLQYIQCRVRQRLYCAAIHTVQGTTKAILRCNTYSAGYDKGYIVLQYIQCRVRQRSDL